MNNKSVLFIGLLLIASLLIGCGNSSAKNEPVIDVTEPLSEEVTETAEKEDIPKKEEEVINEPEETEEPKEEEDANEIEEAGEIDLPSQEDYWHLNYFDLKQYLFDCGAKDVTTSTENLGPDPSIYIADFGDFYLEISTGYYEHVPNIYVGTTLPDTDGFYRDFDYNDDFTKIIIIVDMDDGTMVHQASIEALPDIIKGIRGFKQTAPGERPIVENCIY